jgi:hypothetical protein
VLRYRRWLNEIDGTNKDASVNPNRYMKTGEKVKI